MSLATLKRKTQTQYHNMSVGSKTGFSINGTHRSQGYVGQSNLSRHFPYTPMRGNVARGCGGKYNNVHVPFCITTADQPIQVKPSSLSNNGMIKTKYRWITRPQPYTTVKINNTNEKTCSLYTTQLSQKTVKDLATCTTEGKSINTLKTCIKNTTARPFGSTIYSPRFTCSITKTVKPNGTSLFPLTQTQYLEKLTKGCDVQKTFTTSNCQLPFV